MPTNSYEMPRFGTDGAHIHGWLLEAKQEGQAWLQTQRSATSWEGARILMDEGDSQVDASSMSNTVYPKAKRIARELVASLSSFKHEGEFVVTWDNTLYDTAHLLTDLDANWYATTHPEQAHRATLQNGVILGTGYWVQTWDNNFWGPGKGDIRLDWMDPSNVTFVQLPKDRDIQNAYVVLLRYELPINLAKRIYAPINGAFAASLVPDQETPSWIQKGLQRVQQFISPALRVAGRTRQDNNGAFPTVDIYHAYTLDPSLNEGFDPITMGAYGTNWSYQVPVNGGPVPTGMINPATGSEWTKPAKWEDCRLFPLRRLTVFSNTGIAYDGSSPWWHGDAPVARVWFNDLPWNALGGSLISDIRTMEQGVQSLMRGMEDSAAARLDPPALYDDSMVSKSWAESVNPRLAGVRAAAPLQQGNPIQFPVDPRIYDVGPWIPAFMQAQEDRMDYLTGARDMIAIAKARQIPGADTLEKLMEMAGPLVQDMVSALTVPLEQLGKWRGSYYFQFYNSARVIRLVGPDDFKPEDWVYEPDKLEAYFKSGMGKAMRDRYGSANATSILQNQSFQFRPEMLLAMQPGMSNDMYTRALRRKISEFRYEVTESGVNEINRMTTKLFYLQLMKEGFPISWWSFAKIARIPNFGPPPAGTNTEMERWIAQQEIKINLQADLQKQLAEQMGGAMPGAGAGGGEMPQQIPNIGEENSQNRGRPQTYRNPPRMVQKDNGARSTVTTA